MCARERMMENHTTHQSAGAVLFYNNLDLGQIVLQMQHCGALW